MGLDGERTYVGFGFGAIQTGLFLYEAFRSGNFGRLVVAEVVPDVVRAVRNTGGFFHVNIAHDDHIESVRVGPIEIFDPSDSEDRKELVAAIADACEIGTAVPSVKYYVTRGKGSLHAVIAAGLTLKCGQDGPRCVIYAAENHNHAAEILEEAVFDFVASRGDEPVEYRCRFLNTVIGKMSGLVDDPSLGGLKTVTPGSERAFLVESFNRIFVDTPGFEAPFSRGIEVFEEKGDLLPFEEAKLFGHNATHALGGYLAQMAGLRLVSDLRQMNGMIDFLRRAFVEESGAALIRKYSGVDELFTEEGYTRYADDLLKRMTNPHLRDMVERVCRDPERKLGWDDRLVGTMRLALSQGVEPGRYALGAAAALALIEPAFLNDGAPAAEFAGDIWPKADAKEAEKITSLIDEARNFLLRWRAASFSDISRLFGGAA